jgi:hypothetical protein
MIDNGGLLYGGGLSPLPIHTGAKADEEPCEMIGGKKA